MLKLAECHEARAREKKGDDPGALSFDGVLSLSNQVSPRTT
jgi:hypothetical protein